MPLFQKNVLKVLQAEVDRLDKVFDRMVNELYGLTKERVIVEGRKNLKL